MKNVPCGDSRKGAFRAKTQRRRKDAKGFTRRRSESNEEDSFHAKTQKDGAKSRSKKNWLGKPWLKFILS